MSAFFYLAWHSARNRFLAQLQRARNPRYAVALLVAALYVWGFLLRPSQPAVSSIFLTRPAATIAALLVATMLGGAWIFGSDKLALAFTPAEVSLLFQAPLSRRALTGYKLYRAQVAVLINCIVWVVLLRRGNAAVPMVARLLGVWVMFSTLNLHRLGAALVQSSWREHGVSGIRRNFWSIAFFAFVTVMVLAGLVQHADTLRDVDGVGSFMLALTDVLSRAPAKYGLMPFTLVLSPTFAMSISEWAHSIGPALALLAVHLWWVLRTDVAFEDAAIEASAARERRRQQSRSRRGGATLAAPTRAAGNIQLATQGHPAWAIVWKNLLCLRRTAELRLLLAPTIVSVMLGAAASSSRGDPALFITVFAMTFATALLVLGGRLIRNDLRHDMLNLPLLKTLPISSHEIVLAEVASSALPMAAMEIALVLIAFVASFFTDAMPVPSDVRIAIAVAAPVALVALNGALLTMQNGLAVLFPTWMRLGTGVSTGVEALGQNLIATIANVLSLGIALLIPLGLAFVGVRYFGLSGSVAIATTILLGAVVLAAETYGVVQFVGRVFRRAEPAAV